MFSQSTFGQNLDAEAWPHTVELSVDGIVGTERAGRERIEHHSADPRSIGRAREGLFGFQDFHFTADRLELRAFSKTHSGGDGPMHVLDGREILLGEREVALGQQ